MVIENGRRIIKVAVEMLMDVSEKLPDEKVDEVIKRDVENKYGTGVKYSWADADEELSPLNER